jgi:hypothetical protein
MWAALQTRCDSRSLMGQSISAVVAIRTAPVNEIRKTAVAARKLRSSYRPRRLATDPDACDPAGGAATAATAAAAAAAAAAASAAAAAAAAASSAAASSAAAGSGELHASRRKPSGFLVEDIECRQIDVGHFLVTQHDVGHEIWRRRRGVCGCNRNGSSGCAPCEQGQSGSSQHRYGFLRSPSLRLLLHTWHSDSSMPYRICRSAYLSYALKKRLARSPHVSVE